MTLSSKKFLVGNIQDRKMFHVQVVTQHESVQMELLHKWYINMNWHQSIMVNCIISFYNKCDIMFNHLNHGNHCGSFRIASCLLEHRLYRIFLRAVKRTHGRNFLICNTCWYITREQRQVRHFLQWWFKFKRRDIVNVLMGKTKVVKIAF